MYLPYTAIDAFVASVWVLKILIGPHNLLTKGVDVPGPEHWALAPTTRKILETDHKGCPKI